MKYILKKTNILSMTITGAWILVSGCAGLPPAGSGHDAIANPVAAMVEIYRGPLNRLQAVRAGACPMHPSCSEYCRLAVLKHGPVIGWVRTCDRLMRCGRDEVELSDRIHIGSFVKIFDPLEANDFWLGVSARPTREKSAGPLDRMEHGP